MSVAANGNRNGRGGSFADTSGSFNVTNTSTNVSGGGGATICSGSRFMRAVSIASFDAFAAGGGGGNTAPDAYTFIDNAASGASSYSLKSNGGMRVGDYTLLKQLGDGTYGTVFLASHNRTHELFAIKRILLDQRSMAAIEKQVRREATLMQGLHHPHVVRLIQVLQTPDAFYFVMELAEGGELFDMVINSRRFSESTARKYFQQLISALYYCHKRDVIHRDLKAENLLLSRTGQLKVCDFGFSLDFKVSELEEGCGGEGGNGGGGHNGTGGEASGFGEMYGQEFNYECGTVEYMAPEYARGLGGFGPCGGGNGGGYGSSPSRNFHSSRRNVSDTSVSDDDGARGADDEIPLDPHMHDLWAAGVILYFMLVGSLPFHGRSEEETLHKICHQPPNLNLIESEGARRLLARMLAIDPTDRPSISEIVADQWFSVGLDYSMFPDIASGGGTHHHVPSSSLHQRNRVDAESAANGGASSTQRRHHHFSSIGSSHTNHNHHLSNSSLHTAHNHNAHLLIQNQRKGSRMFLDFSSPLPSGDNIDLLLTEAEHDAIGDAFAMMDVDDDGILTRDEIRDAILELNPHRQIPAEEVATVVNCFIPQDASPDDGIDLETFKHAWVERDIDHVLALKSISYFRLKNLCSLVHAPVDARIVMTVRNVFNKIDADHDGVFNAKDIERLIGSIGNTIGGGAGEGSRDSISFGVSPPSPCATVPDMFANHSSQSSPAGREGFSGKTVAAGAPNGGQSSCALSHSQVPSSASSAAGGASSTALCTAPSHYEKVGCTSTSCDATAVRELISYLDTKGSGNIMFDEFLTATARSNVLLDHRVGSLLKKVIPEISELRSRLMLTGSRFTVCGTLESVTEHLKSYSPEKLRFEQSAPTPARSTRYHHTNDSGASAQSPPTYIELQFDYLRPDDDSDSRTRETSPLLSEGAFGAMTLTEDGTTARTTVLSSALHSHPNSPVSVAGAGAYSIPPTPPNGRSQQTSGFGGGSPNNTTTRRGGADPLADVHSPPCSASCRLAIQLSRLCDGFVGVSVTRIAGPTMHFHDAMSLVIASLEDERERAVHDTQPVGDSELM